MESSRRPRSDAQRAVWDALFAHFDPATPATVVEIVAKEHAETIEVIVDFLYDGMMAQVVNVVVADKAQRKSLFSALIELAVSENDVGTISRSMIHLGTNRQIFVRHDAAHKAAFSIQTGEKIVLIKMESVFLSMEGDEERALWAAMAAHLNPAPREITLAVKHPETLIALLARFSFNGCTEPVVRLIARTLEERDAFITELGRLAGEGGTIDNGKTFVHLSNGRVIFAGVNERPGAFALLALDKAVFFKTE